jgi:EpsI family protein
MANPLTKIVIAFALLGAFGAGTFYLYYEIGRLKGVELPCERLAQLPKTLGPWNGKDHEIDKRMFRITQASEVLGRLYTDLGGNEVTLHMGVYGDFWYGVPHSPFVCYQGTGWIRVKTDPETLDVPGAPPLNIMFVTFEMEGRRILVGFWYQLGPLTVTDSPELREAQVKLRDCKKWPSIIKVLLQTDAGNADQAKKRLVDVASRVYAWSSRMQYGEATPSPADSGKQPPAGQAGTK